MGMAIVDRGMTAQEARTGRGGASCAQRRARLLPSFGPMPPATALDCARKLRLRRAGRAAGQIDKLPVRDVGGRGARTHSRGCCTGRSPAMERKAREARPRADSATGTRRARGASPSGQGCARATLPGKQGRRSKPDRRRARWSDPEGARSSPRFNARAGGPDNRHGEGHGARTGRSTERAPGRAHRAGEQRARGAGERAHRGAVRPRARWRPVLSSTRRTRLNARVEPNARVRRLSCTGKRAGAGRRCAAESTPRAPPDGSHRADED
jgi:hypothetical protein